MTPQDITPAHWADLTACHPDLHHLPPPIAGKAKLMTLAPEAVLFRRGEPPCVVHYLVEGEIHMLRHSRNGGVAILLRAQRGFFAAASLDAPAYHCNAVAKLACSVLTFPLPAFQAALDDSKAFRRATFAQQAKEIRRLRSQCERLSLPTAQGRLIHYIDIEGQDGVVDLTQTVKALAAELGLTHETLYRTLAQMEKTRVLKRTGNRIELHAPFRRVAKPARPSFEENGT